ncbi:IclR family transcriptional regulator [Pseudooceanicola nitratireducens]|jgi:DNA-binding IclR family transcriptional regulator|uniref:IclR family transcriptional regulator n=1 Tax=Pseudooceanicola nitratireducens TaxID=517719 RepID=UPI001C961A5C|nr:IclR family transcriptional regulator [Pseudooceanicola nitratireducens]MBY6165533.1 IclR family transcriptional regulator [Pseudooceanicola nitratireducens]
MIKSVDKALRLLEILSQSKTPMRLRDIAAASELTRSNAFRMLQTLRDLGYVEQVGDGSQYDLTLKVFEIGARKVASNTLVSSAHPVLQRLSERVSENVMLSVREGLTSVVVDRIESRAFVRTFAHLGARAPLHAVSGGKVLLAWAPEEIIEAMSAKLTGFTEHTITDPDRLMDEIARIRTQGYATAFHEINEAARGVSVPIRSRLGDVAAALSISGPMEDLNDAMIEHFVTELKAHAAQVEQAWPGTGQPSVPLPSNA